MKFFIYATLFLSGLFLISCQSTKDIYIVRHAEKSTEPANDPHLTAEGKLRAETLKDILKDKKIKAIFSTEKQRTVETATPLSKLMNIPIQYYGNDTLKIFLQMVTGLKKNALIIGHSNTCITMISTLNLPYTITFIPDNGYENIFILKIKKRKPVKIIETYYNSLSPKN